MGLGRSSGFTLVELLVVVAIIATLAMLATPILSDMWRSADQVKCANNLRQMGLWLINQSLREGAYPAAGWHPGGWQNTYNLVVGSLGKAEIAQCPSAPKNSPINPTIWSTCSYAYLGNLNPTYTCTCSNCGEEGKKIWRLYWSGVDYAGGHKTEDGTNTDKDLFKDYELSDNIVFNPDKVDEGEPSNPTCPVHLDTEKFHEDDRPKDRSQRALRQVPATPEDNRAGVPLLTDIVVLRQKPSAAPSWKDAHRYITDENRDAYLYANHSNTSATHKKDWGINVLYVDQSVRWKEWDALRFQVLRMDVSVGGDSENHFYYY